MATATQKVCQKCHKDLTGRSRLKDASGNYFCKNCAPGGMPGSLMDTCKKCGKPTHVTDMHRLGGEYVCSSCARGDKDKPSRSGGGGKLATKLVENKPLAFGLVFILLGGLYMVYINVWQ